MQLQAPPAYTAADSPQKKHLAEQELSKKEHLMQLTRLQHCQPWVSAPVVLLEGAEQIPWGDLLHRLLKSCLTHWCSKRVFLYFPYDLFSSLLAENPNLQGTIKGCSVTLLKRREAVCLTLLFVYTRVQISSYCNFKNRQKGITKTKMGRGEGGGGNIMTTRSFAYMLACGNNKNYYSQSPKGGRKMMMYRIV